MYKDFTIIFEKLDEQTQVAEASTQQGGVIILSGESLAELDELAELRRVVSEITDPEPLSFTSA
jgi:hypothetical protein